MRTAIRGATCLTPFEQLDDATILIEGDVIADVTGDAEPDVTADRTIDADGCHVVPGFIDVHTHGGGGHDVMTASPVALEGFGRFLAAHGVTSYLATTVSAPRVRIDAVIEAVGAMPSTTHGARPLGVHLEGPYLAEDHRGAQALGQLRGPDPGEYGNWIDSGVVRLMTIAPELDGSDALIDAARAGGVELAVGHSGATFDQMVHAVERGVRQVTHTFNGMEPMHHREPGALGALLVDDRVFAQVILDGVHVHPAIVDLLVRVKGVERTVLVTDSIAAAGLPDGDHELGGVAIRVVGGVSRTSTGGLAGSTLTLDAAVRRAHHELGLPLTDCVAMATATPAAAMGWLGERGQIAEGLAADVCILDANLEVLATFVGGELVHQDDRWESER